MSFVQRHNQPLRLFVLLAALAWGFYCYGYLGSLGVLSVGMVLFSSALVLPFMLLPFLGYAWPHAARGALLLALLSCVLAYTWLNFESHALVQAAQASETTTLMQRSWPFANSAVLYHPEFGVSWQD